MSQRTFAVFDIDGTLIRWQLYHAIADNLAKLGYIDEDSFKQVRQARMVWKRREYEESFRDYEIRLVQLMTNIMLQLSVEQFEEAAQAVFEEYKDQVYVYTRELIKKLKGKGHLIFAISGSQKQVVQKIAEYYKFDDFISRVDEQEQGSFTGKSTTPIFNKDQALKELIKRNPVSIKGSYGIGDSYSDIRMLEMVDNPVAFNPEKKLFEHASLNGWKVVLERKNVVYELFPAEGGYRLAETNS